MQTIGSELEKAFPTDSSPLPFKKSVRQFNSIVGAVRISFSHAEASFVLPVLRGVVEQTAMYEAGEITGLRTHPNVGRAGFDAGEYHWRHLEAFRTALRKLELVQAPRRTVKLDAFELAACAFCLARARRWIRHGHAKPWPLVSALLAERLMKKLEKYRKRAKRAFLTKQGHSAFAAERASWKRSLRWVRVHFLSCTCDRSRPIALRPILLAHREERIRYWMKDVGDEINKWRDKILPEPELRRLVILALRSFRRKYGIPGNPPRDGRRSEMHAHIERFVFKKLGP